jgi:hypothetical protein
MEEKNKSGKILALIFTSVLFYVMSTFFIPYGEGVLLVGSTGIGGSFTQFITIIGYFSLAVG